MDDPVGVGVHQRGRNVLRDLNGFLNRKSFLTVQEVAERLTFHEWHDIVEERVRLSRVEEGNDMRMLQVGCDFNLFQEPLGAEDGG